jgi:hypothetical protein
MTARAHDGSASRGRRTFSHGSTDGAETTVTERNDARIGLGVDSASVRAGRIVRDGIDDARVSTAVWLPSCVGRARVVATVRVCISIEDRVTTSDDENCSSASHENEA